jgi:hypothetical protein
MKTPINLCLDHFATKTAQQWAEFCEKENIGHPEITEDGFCIFCTANHIKKLK